jgi:predicted glycosyltransferase
MNLLAARVPAMVLPYSKQREQPIRVEKIKNFIPMKILRDKDIEPVQLNRYIQEMLLEPRPLETVPINLDGAANTARWLEDWYKKHKQTTKSRKDESTK